VITISFLTLQTKLTDIPVAEKMVVCGFVTQNVRKMDLAVSSQQTEVHAPKHCS
jgi:hypothetical protein